MFWLLLNGSLATDVIVIGAIASAVITFAFRNNLGWFSELRLTTKAMLTTVAYVFFYIKELVKSNVNVALIVLSPSLPVNPGIVTVRTWGKKSDGTIVCEFDRNMLIPKRGHGVEDKVEY